MPAGRKAHPEGCAQYCCTYKALHAAGAPALNDGSVSNETGMGVASHADLQYYGSQRVNAIRTGKLRSCNSIFRQPCDQCPSCLHADLALSAFRRAREVCELVSNLLNAHIPLLLLSAISRLILRVYKILIAATRLHITPKGAELVHHSAWQQCE